MRCDYVNIVQLLWWDRIEKVWRWPCYLGHIPTHVPSISFSFEQRTQKHPREMPPYVSTQSGAKIAALSIVWTKCFPRKLFLNFWKSSFVALGDRRFGSRATDGPKKWECACDRCREGQKKNSQLSLLDNSTIITTIIFYISTIHILHFHNKRFHILLSTCR
jgi:hypothetical protein